MKYLTGNEIRNTWLRFFKEKGHSVEEGASLIPNNDPTLLWMNSGVAALKKYFDGRVVPKNPRIVNVQKCIRTNDIENVGNTARHHTFFEMMGNFSIGDYFRDEAIEYGFELLTSEDYFNFPIEKLYFTYYPTDLDTKQRWLDLGISEEHLIPSEGNFWEIGSGPCGPCTEIFYDRGEMFGDFTTESIKKDIENDRYVELWNIVLSQYNAIEGLDREKYPELPSKNIDTGAGLERFASVIQGAKTNFETDLFMPIINKISEIANVEYQGQKAFKVIADHIRTVTMAISDGAMLSNEGRGYVLRRLLRRAVKYGKQLKIEKPFLVSLVDEVVEVLRPFYPYIDSKIAIVKKIVETEENKFLETLLSGEKKLNEIMGNSQYKTISGEDAFLLYDTYGFPLELTEEYALEQGYKVDLLGFKNEMEKQKDRARKARAETDSMMGQNEEFLNFVMPSEFVGYETTKSSATIIKVFNEGLVLDKTPFYATSGGQLADQGKIYNDKIILNVIDVEKMPNGQFLHKVDEELSLNYEGMKVIAEVDSRRRELTEYHHSATHLLFKALRDTLGNHVSQQGSQVSYDGLRFDFNHYENISDEMILRIEKIVNEMIKDSYKSSTKIMSVEEAKNLGAIAEFGEKYGDKVRTIDLKYTLDLCGGTHVKDIADIEKFAIKSLSSIGSGIYRIEALVNVMVEKLDESLVGLNQDIDNLMIKANKILSSAKDEDIKIDFDFKKNDEQLGSYKDVINKREELHKAQVAVKELEKAYNHLKEEKAKASVSDFSKYVINNKIVAELDNINGSALKQLADEAMANNGVDFVFLASSIEDKVIFVAKSNVKTLNAGQIVKEAAIICGGNGGGRPDFAQAGGKDVSKIKDALIRVKEIVL
ncbi:MAG: alanine--tRNA ligase [Candidatus Izemoplasmatales bacterium]|jgi:alanyl-tRNA synthetase|nr:alanine--tRNA ligase [Candidatus Izemoplasmatales bacterium]